MREIKFRGKNKDSNKWVYGYLVVDEKYTQIWQKGDVPVIVDPETVGQYIGFKDMPPGIKEKVEMYEGDMVRLYTYFDEEGSELNESTIHQIVYDLESDYPAFDLKPYGDWECNGISWALCATECDGIEVIGYATDNPELLKEKNK